MYVTDEVLTDMAERIATAVAEHQGVVNLDAERRRRRQS